MEQAKGFFGSLFDFSFSSFVTTKIIKLLYVVAIILSAIAAIAMIGSAFAKSVPWGILAIVLSPILFFIYVLFSRVWLELIIIMFRIAEYVRDIANK